MYQKINTFNNFEIYLSSNLENRIDQVDNAVRGEDVGGDDFGGGGAGDGDDAVVDHRDVLPSRRADHRTSRGNVLGPDDGRNNVAEENRGEGVLVGQQALDIKRECLVQSRLYTTLGLRYFVGGGAPPS